MQNVDAVYTLAAWRLAGYQVSTPIELLATAYDACVSCTGKTDGITKSSSVAKPNHTIAVDPRRIPLGSRIFVPELNTIFTAEDTGGMIKGQRVDIYMDTHQQALQFGVQKLTAHILRQEEGAFL